MYRYKPFVGRDVLAPALPINFDTTYEFNTNSI
jgi:hypothetical protein